MACSKLSRRSALVGLAHAATGPLWLAGCTGAPTPGTPGAAGAPAGAAGPGWTNQPVFSIVRLDIRDAKAFGEYIVGHTPTVAAVGGRFIAAGALPEVLEGTWPARRMLIVQWTSAQVFFDWHNGAAYAPWKRMRRAATATDLVLAQGVASSVPAAEVAPIFALTDAQVRDGISFGRYVQGHQNGLRAAGGELLVAGGGRVEVIEGDWQPARLSMVRWPSAAAFRSWWASPEYRPWRELRQTAASAHTVLVAGLSEKTKIERRIP